MRSHHYNLENINIFQVEKEEKKNVLDYCSHGVGSTWYSCFQTISFLRHISKKDLVFDSVTFMAIFFKVRTAFSTFPTLDLRKRSAGLKMPQPEKPTGAKTMSTLRYVIEVPVSMLNIS